jgi:hypothetical protein
MEAQWHHWLSTYFNRSLPSSLKTNTSLVIFIIFIFGYFLLSGYCQDRKEITICKKKSYAIYISGLIYIMSEVATKLKENAQKRKLNKKR